MKRLRDRMREDLALRGMSIAAIESYVRCARKFAEHFGRSPCAMGVREVMEFLLHLSGRGLSPSTLTVYGGALRFLRRDARPAVRARASAAAAGADACP